MTRAETLREKIASFADAIIITDELNQYYIGGFRYTDGYVVVTKKSAHIVTDFRYIEAAEALSPAGFEIVAPKNMREYIADVFKKENVKTVAFEEDRVTYSALEALKKDISAEFVTSRGVIEEMRRYKDRGEVEKILAAQKITDDAFEHILKVMTPDMTELDVAVELEFFMRKAGAEEKSFDTIAVSGSTSSLPHGVPRNVKLEKGFFTMDYGCVVDGYHSDMTRTVVLGKADEDMKKLYNTVLKAQVSAIEGAKVGMKCSAIDAIARDIIEDAGYHGCFGHGTGHGVGLEIHEEPRFSPKSSDFFKSGHIITVEPGIYIAGKGGCRIEDMIYADGEKVVNLTGARKELIELF
ncbi:MAG: aminopeptidase P family protein [Ruminococcaceae bacterium]|nr:aminopeptidase P family protein [Oscillospiraceae bacterium]